MIVVFGGQANEDLQRVARLLSGADLFRDGRSEPVAMLSRIPESDNVDRRYTAAGHQPGRP